MEIQARIPAALCAIHNFIQSQDPNEGDLPGQRRHIPFSNHNDEDHPPESAQLPDGPQARPDAQAQAGDTSLLMRLRRDSIAQQMWDDYQLVLLEQGSLESDGFTTSKSGSDSEELVEPEGDSDL